MIRRALLSTLFPYTTLFRSPDKRRRAVESSDFMMLQFYRPSGNYLIRRSLDEKSLELEEGLFKYWPRLLQVFAPAWPGVGASVAEVVCRRDVLALQLSFQVVSAVVNGCFDDAAFNLQGSCTDRSCSRVNTLTGVVGRHIGLTWQAIAGGDVQFGATQLVRVDQSIVLAVLLGTHWAPHLLWL